MSNAGGASTAALKQTVQQQEAEIAALRDELEAARAAAAEPGAPADAGTAMVGVFERLLEKIDDLGKPTHEAHGLAYKPGESKAQIEHSLDRAISSGVPLPDGRIVEHSGRRLDHPLTFKQLRGKNLNVVRKARSRVVDRTGEPIVTVGVHYNFAPDGTFTTDDEDVVEYLKRRPGFNLEYAVLGEEPGRVPDAGPTLDRIMDLRARYDMPGLDEIEHQERQSHRREIVMQTVAAAKAAIRRDEQALIETGKAPE